MNLTADIIRLSCGTSVPTAAAWLTPLQAACDRFSINTPLRVAAFLATVGVESAHLSKLAENLNYSAQGLANTWPFRYAVDPHATPKVPNARAVGIARDPEAIANNCYADRNGNGDEASGDGWRYRGQGLIELTGKGNIQAFFAAVGLPPDTDPVTLQQPTNGALSAAWFWSRNNLNPLADARKFLAVSRAVNLGDPNSTAMPLGWDQRQALYKAACAALGI